MGYQKNKYYWCFMNKIVNNKECTILLHVDGLNISCVDPDIVSNFLFLLIHNMEIVRKLTSRGVKYLNNSV